MPSQSSSLPSDLQAFIKAEMARRCLSSEEECLHALAREVMAQQNVNQTWDASHWSPSPPQSSPDYDPVLHGPRSADELDRLLEEGLNSGPPIEATPEYWANKKATLMRRHGINEE